MKPAALEADRPGAAPPRGIPAVRVRSNPFLATIRLATLITCSAAMCSFFVLRRSPLRERRARLRLTAVWIGRWCAMCRWALGWKVRIEGPPPPPGSVITPNHTGYGDILALAAIGPMFFVPKADVARWPGISILCRAAMLPMVSRRAEKGLVEAMTAIGERLDAGVPVCVFLEGTSTGGDRLLPFRPALLAAAVERSAPVVPAALHWSSNDPAMNPAEDIAYWKDHSFAPHLWRLAGLSGVVAKIRLGPPISSANTDRRELADTLRREVGRLGTPTWIKVK